MTRSPQREAGTSGRTSRCQGPEAGEACQVPGPGLAQTPSLGPSAGSPPRLWLRGLKAVLVSGNGTRKSQEVSLRGPLPVSRAPWEMQE